MVVVGERYRHYKRGGTYLIVAIAAHHETFEPWVVYRAEYGDGKTFIRPLEMFEQEVEHEGKRVPRFELIG